MRKPAPRTERIGSLIQEALGRLLIEEFQLPGAGFLTVTRVEMSRDLLTARVFVAVFGVDRPEEAVRGLERRAGHIRRILASRLNLKYNPALFFVPDPGPGQEERIDKIRRTDRGHDGD